MKGYKRLVMVGVLILAVAITSGFIGYRVGKEKARAGGPFGQQLTRAERIERLNKLRNEDPEKFKRLLVLRRKMLLQGLARLKEENPQRHQEIVQKQIDRLEAVVERLKQELPETAQQ